MCFTNQKQLSCYFDQIISNKQFSPNPQFIRHREQRDSTANIFKSFSVLHYSIYKNNYQLVKQFLVDEYQMITLNDNLIQTIQFKSQKFRYSLPKNSNILQLAILSSNNLICKLLLQFLLQQEQKILIQQLFQKNSNNQSAFQYILMFNRSELLYEIQQLLDKQSQQQNLQQFNDQLIENLNNKDIYKTSGIQYLFQYNNIESFIALIRVLYSFGSNRQQNDLQLLQLFLQNIKEQAQNLTQLLEWHGNDMFSSKNSTQKPEFKLIFVEFCGLEINLSENDQLTKYISRLKHVDGFVNEGEEDDDQINFQNYFNNKKNE